jgi:hypothetical protein
MSILKPPFCIVRYSDKAMLSAYENALETNGPEWTHNKHEAFTFDRLAGEFSAQSYVNKHIELLCPGVSLEESINHIGIVEYRSR